MIKSARTSGRVRGAQVGTGWSMSCLSGILHACGVAEKQTQRVIKQKKLSGPLSVLAGRETCPVRVATSQCQLYNNDEDILLHLIRIHCIHSYAQIHKSMTVCNYVYY